MCLCQYIFVLKCFYFVTCFKSIFIRTLVVQIYLIQFVENISWITNQPSHIASVRKRLTFFLNSRKCVHRNAFNSFVFLNSNFCRDRDRKKWQGDLPWISYLGEMWRRPLSHSSLRLSGFALTGLSLRSYAAFGNSGWKRLVDEIAIIPGPFYTISELRTSQHWP